MFAHRNIFFSLTKFFRFDNNSIFISMIRNSFKLTIINLNDNNHDENVNTIFEIQNKIIFIHYFYWIFFTNEMLDFIIAIFNCYFYSFEILTTQTQNNFNELSTTTSKNQIFYEQITIALIRIIILFFDDITLKIKFEF